MEIRNIVFTAAIVLIVAGSCSPKMMKVEKEPQQKAGFDTADYNLIFNDALRQKMLGNHVNAVRLFERALKLNSSSDASCYQLSQLYQGAGDPANSIKYAARAELLDPLNSWYTYNAGVLYYMVGKKDSAVYYFEKLILLEPEREDYRLTLAGFYEGTGQYDRALTIVESFIEKYGEDEELLTALVRINSLWGKESEAENAIIRLINSDADKVKSYGMLAEFFKQHNREEEALSVYSRLFEIDPDNPELQLSYLDFLRVYKRYDDFISELSAVVLNDSISIEGKRNLFAGILADDEIIMEKKVEIELLAMLLTGNYPDNPDIILLAAQIFEACDKDERAIETLKHYCEKNPENYIMWERLLFAYSSGEQTDDLYMTAKYVATKFNLYPIPKLLLAFAASERREYDLALAELDKALTLSGNQKELLIEITSLLANVYYEKGDIDKAFMTYSKGIELSPDNAMLLNNYAYYLSEQNVRLKDAGLMIEKCLKIETNSTYLDTYAWVMYKSGKYKKANTIMQGLVEIDAMETADHFEHYGFIRKALKDCNEAVEMWNIAREMDESKVHLLEEIQKCQKEK